MSTVELLGTTVTVQQLACIAGIFVVCDIVVDVVSVVCRLVEKAFKLFIARRRELKDKHAA